MKAIVSAAVLGLLATDRVTTDEFEHVAKLVLAENAPEFTMSNGRRQIEYRDGRLSIQESGVLDWPRCWACAKRRRNAAYRAAIGSRLCGQCFEAYAEREARRQRA